MFGQGQRLSKKLGFLTCLLFCLASFSFAAKPVNWAPLAQGIDTSYDARGSERGIYLARIDLDEANISLDWAAGDFNGVVPADQVSGVIAVNSDVLQRNPNTSKSSSSIFSSLLTPFPIFATVNMNQQHAVKASLKSVLAPQGDFRLTAPNLMDDVWMEELDQTGNYTVAGLSRDGKTLYIATALHLPLFSLSQTMRDLDVDEALLLQKGADTEFVAANGSHQQVLDSKKASFYDFHAGGLDALLGTDHAESDDKGESGTLMIISR
jgi:hypothetical protein